eukprot:5974776-Prymnesium_polylepis.1
MAACAGGAQHAPGQHLCDQAVHGGPQAAERHQLCAEQKSGHWRFGVLRVPFPRLERGRVRALAQCVPGVAR